ncbi:TniQ family protein [Cellulomonas sp. KH9]|uniref:TniQ family protein n=1 Tax=Cellulomonas sp. KH9 TaxID=1855324 RepID=UPI000B800B21
MPQRPAPRAAEPPAAGARRLRSAGGGYVVDRMPIAVPRHDDEHVGSWLVRFANRYALSPRDLLRSAGVDVLPQRFLHLDKLPAPARSVVAERLAVTVDDLSDLRGGIGRALADARAEYRRELGLEARAPALSRTKFCPDCLRRDGYWRESWTDPLHLVCIEHRVELMVECPGCDRPPFGGTAWHTSRTGVTICPAFDTLSSGGRYRRRCLTDFATIEAPTVFAEVVKAQANLFDLAARAATAREGLVESCGTLGRAQTVLEAWLTIIDRKVNAARAPRLEVYMGALLDADAVLSTASLVAAGREAVRRQAFGQNNELAPLASDTHVRSKPRNPLIVAITLTGLRGRFSLGAELSHRLGSERPRYPDGVNPTTRLLQASDGRSALPLAWIPQVVDEGALGVDAKPELGINSPLGRAFTATCLARYGTDRPWGRLAIALGLPAMSATQFRTHWWAIYDAKLWPAYLAALDDLYHRIHETPPTVDYQRRRLEVAEVDELLRACRQAAHRLGDTARPRAAEAMACRFWLDHTGGHSAFAQAPLGRAEPPDLLSSSLSIAIGQELGLCSDDDRSARPP